MANNKAYFPKDALARHEDFDVWYEDGALLLHIEGPWTSEKDKVAIIGRWGGEVGHIKPDYRTLAYYVRMERWEYCMHPYTIFHHYYIEGMLWDIYGSMEKGSFHFVREATKDGKTEKDGHVKVVNFKGHGECYEVMVKDVAKLRIAVASVIAIAIKEEFRGLSEGEENPNPTLRERIKNNVFGGKGKTCEQALADWERDSKRYLGM